MRLIYCSYGNHTAPETDFWPSTIKGRNTAWCKVCRRYNQQELREQHYEEAMADPNWTQQCGCCGEWLTKEHFYDAQIGRNGFYCKGCLHQYERERYAKGYRRPDRRRS